MFRDKGEAMAWMDEAYGADSEGGEWARALPADDFDALVKRHAGG
jgi:hypothetical protein